MSNNRYKSLLDLLKRDQENIRNLREKNIDFEDFQIESKRVSEDFKKCIKKEGFPYNDGVSENVYKAGIALSSFTYRRFKKVF